MPPETEAARPSNDLIDFLSRAVRLALDAHGQERLQDWLLQQDDAGLPSELRERLPASFERPALAAALGRAIWSALPLPSNDYRPRPLATPERNASCPCGSGEKFKRCCGRWPALAPLPLDAVWTALALQLPPETLLEAARRADLSALQLEDVADNLIERRDSPRALALVEGALGAERRLDERQIGAVELWAALTGDLHGSAAERQLVERLLEKVAPRLQPMLWQRLAGLEHEQGNDTAAWELFGRAQRADPEDPQLASLEVSLLCGERRFDEARRRARFWRAKLERRDDVDQLDHVLEVVRQVEEDPEGFEAANWESAPALSTSEDVVVQLVQLFVGARRSVLPPYVLRVAGSAAVLEPPEGLAAIEREWPIARWAAALGALAGRSEAGPAPLELLEDLIRRPVLIDSLIVLDQLATLIEAYPADARLDDLEFEVAEHAQAIIEAALADAPEGLRLPWTLSENRPVLRLLSFAAMVLEVDGLLTRATAVRTRLWRLDPQDALGNRVALLRALFESGDTAAALDLCEAFPDDPWPDLYYGRGLALWRLRRRADAERALRAALEMAPTVAEYLVAERPRQPRLDPLRGALVSDREVAWLYRKEWLPIWRKSPAALEFLATLTGLGEP